jgi:hypothetical protein
MYPSLFGQWLSDMFYGPIPPYMQPAIMSHQSDQSSGQVAPGMQFPQQMLQQTGNLMNASSHPIASQLSSIQSNIPTMESLPVIPGTESAPLANLPLNITKRAAGFQQPSLQLPSLPQLPQLPRPLDMGIGNGAGIQLPNWRPSSLFQEAGSDTRTHSSGGKGKGCGKK